MGSSAVKHKTPPLFELRSKAQAQIFIWVTILGVLALQTHLGNEETKLIVSESLVVFFGGAASLSRITRSGFWSPATLFYVLLGVFHLGLVIHWGLEIDPMLPREADYFWFLGDVGMQSLVIVLIALAAYVLGATIFVVFYPIDRATTVVEGPDADLRSKEYSAVGAWLTVMGVVGWFVVGLTLGNWTVFFGSYSNWLRVTGDSGVINGVYVLIGVGLGLALIAPATRFVHFALVLFAVFASVAFFLGLRGEVLFPIAVAAAVIGFRRSMPGLAATTTAALTVLFLISAAKLIRQLGIADTSFSWAEANPLTALAEIGSTIRVVATTVTWHSVNGEPFRGGDTYSASLLRLYEAVVTPLNRPQGHLDFRLMNSEIATRVGNVGGSAIAEAFHNWAVPGVVIVFLSAGVLFGYFSNMALTGTKIAIYVCIAVPLFNHVRNSFVPVVPTILASLVLVLLMRMFGEISSRSRRRL